jgi:hypothetical protein
LSEKIIQPKKLFRILKVKDFEEAERVFASTIGFFLYLPTGHTIRTSTASFEKLSDDLIHISSDLDTTNLNNFLEKTGTIRFPV